MAKAQVENNARTELERAGLASRDRLDGYLRQVERDRADQKQHDRSVRSKYNEKAREQEKAQEQKRSNEALTRAFEKAQRQQEQQRQREQDRETQDQEKSRERGRS